MNEYEKGLFEYIMTNKMGKTLSRRDYLLADEQEKAHFESLYSTLNPDQRKQFRRYEEQCNEKAVIDLEQMFIETLAAIRMLLT